jgi:hypothetical protein
MLQETANDGAHPDPFGQFLHPGPQRADAPYQQVDVDPRPAGAVERNGDLLVHNRVDLDVDPSRAAGPDVFHLALDPFDDARAHAVRGDQQAPVRGLAAVPGQYVEQVGEVRADVGVGGEQAEVLVDARVLGW